MTIKQFDALLISVNHTFPYCYFYRTRCHLFLHTLTPSDGQSVNVAYGYKRGSYQESHEEKNTYQ